MKLIILDRDGVINQDSDEYIKSAREWQPIPGSLEAIARLHSEGYKILVATNQSGVGRGLFGMDDLNSIHQKMIEEIRRLGGEIDGIFFCPHSPEDNCDCRKPKTGLFKEIADRMQISLEGVLAVGDSERDLVAAQAVNARPVLVLTGKGKKARRPAVRKMPELPVYDNLLAFSDALLHGQITD